MDDDQLGPAEQLVDELYSFRDRFFESHPLSAADQKASLIESRLDTTIKQLEQLELRAAPSSPAERARWLLFRGKALNITEDFNPGALEALSRAVKLQPRLVEAWCQLGEAYWKRGEVRAAHNCFNSALGHGRERRVLRSLSMVLRALPEGTVEERASRVNESVTLAKEAVQSDISDGRSWTVLANAYLAQYVILGQPPSLMRKCLSAYGQAEKDSVAAADADLHHNRAVARLQLGEFCSALTGLEHAAALDPAWPAPRDKAAALRAFLLEALRLTRQCGAGLRDKKLHQAQAVLRERSTKDLSLYSTKMEPITVVQIAAADGSSAKGRMLLLKVGRLLPHFGLETYIHAVFWRIDVIFFQEITAVFI